jgi:hypothetical protein
MSKSGEFLFLKWAFNEKVWIKIKWFEAGFKTKYLAIFENTGKPSKLCEN